MTHEDETIDADQASIARLEREALDASARLAPVAYPVRPDHPGSAADEQTPPPASGAREFLAETRHRQGEAESEIAQPKSGNRRGSGMVVAFAVVAAAQILAAGVYFSLRTLQSEPEPSEVVTTQDDLVELPTPTARPSREPTATSFPTATPVPPTPTWRPVQDGPRLAPFTFIVDALVASPAFFDAPDGNPIEPLVDEEPLANPWPSGAPLTLRVTSGEPGSTWAQVALPADLDVGPTAWVRSEDFDWSSSNRLVQVDVMANQLRVFEGNNVIFVAAIASGRRSSPTPQLRSWIVENPVGSEVAGATPELLVAGTADGAGLRIAPTSDDSTIGEYVTSGEVLVGATEARQLAGFVAAGSKVEVIGVPTQPTPTPLPTPTPRPADEVLAQVGPVDTLCPGRAQGTPPNCYRVVDRDHLAGECPRREVILENQCMILAGDPDITRDGPRCPESAPRSIDNRCYTPNGPIPTEDGDCPAQANDVAGECRVPT